MAQVVTGVLKKDRIRAGQPCAIGAAATQPGAAPGAAGCPMVRVIEQHADHAILEVRCTCGRGTHIECRWNASGGGDAAGAVTPDAQDRSGDSDKETK